MKIVEICCGTYSDAAAAAAGGADRIELTNAMFMGGLTPSLATLRMVKKNLTIKTIAMVRPRGGGFCYTPEELEVMEMDARILMENGADGIIFGCLNPDSTINVEANRRLADIAHEFGGEAAFHRAFDCTPDPYTAIEALIDIGIDRVLTSGQTPRPGEGVLLLKELQERYGDRIEILMLGGMSAEQGNKLYEETGIEQFHTGCRTFIEDPTTAAGKVSYGYLPTPREAMYDAVDAEKVRTYVNGIKG